MKKTKLNAKKQTTFYSAFDKLVVSQLGPSEPFVRIYDQKAFYKVLSLARNVSPSQRVKIVLATFNDLEQLHMIWVVKWGCSAKHQKKDDPKTPIITPHIIWFQHDDFWGHVTGRACRSCCQLCSRKETSQPEI